MEIKHNLSSKSYNSFGIDSPIITMIEINDKKELFLLKDVLQNQSIKVLGGGSNILLTSKLEAPILHVNNQGIEIVKDAETYVLVRFEAGEVWTDAVSWAVDNGYGGIENLALIPGRCGAAPMQNIGAYGIEIKDVLHTVTAYERESGLEYILHNSECHFGYRSSHFKTKWKDKFIITSIVLKLTKDGYHKLNTSYGAINQSLMTKGITEPSISNVMKVVTEIRQAKLPDPKQIGNAGSFFKNPIVSKATYERLILEFPDMPSYPIDESMTKIPAAWLIDQCGWKGKVIGKTGTYKNQALVIVNHGDANGQDIYDLSQKILESVQSKYNVTLEREVNIW